MGQILHVEVCTSTSESEELFGRITWEEGIFLKKYMNLGSGSYKLPRERCEHSETIFYDNSIQDFTLHALFTFRLFIRCAMSLSFKKAHKTK